MSGRVILSTFVPGRAAPKGSMDFMPNGYAKQSNPNTDDWQACVADHCRPLVADRGARPGVWTWREGYPHDGPVWVSLGFAFLRPVAPRFEFPATRGTGDIDKLLRCIYDGLDKGTPKKPGAGVITDDARVCSGRQDAVWTREPSAVGVAIVVETL